jgi:hypothetical protein
MVLDILFCLLLQVPVGRADDAGEPRKAVETKKGMTGSIHLFGGILLSTHPHRFYSSMPPTPVRPLKERKNERSGRPGMVLG